MNKLTYYLVILSVFTPCFATNQINYEIDHRNTLYFGHFHNLPNSSFTLIYGGELISVANGDFTIKDSLLPQINVLFVDPDFIHFKTADNTVLERSLKTKDYRFFRFELMQFKADSKAIDKQEDEYISSWIISENKSLTVIPINTIIVPINPVLIDIELENVTYKPNNLKVTLPNITIKAKPRNILADLMIESYLKAISLKPFHAKQKIKSCFNKSTKISMVI